MDSQGTTCLRKKLGQFPKQSLLPKLCFLLSSEADSSQPTSSHWKQTATSLFHSTLKSGHLYFEYFQHDRRRRAETPTKPFSFRESGQVKVPTLSPAPSLCQLSQVVYSGDHIAPRSGYCGQLRVYVLFLHRIRIQCPAPLLTHNQLLASVSSCSLGCTHMRTHTDTCTCTLMLIHTYMYAYTSTHLKKSL